ncbi:DUF2461 domain-containing protein [soil metagenome]
MLQPDTLQFLLDLNVNNNKTWFDANRKRFEAAKKDVEQLVGEILIGCANFEPALIDFKAKDCVFRIYRDVRFSKDKTPYKNNMGAWFNKGGKKAAHAGYYLHSEPGNSMLAGGMYMPESEQLRNVRQEIDYNTEEFKNILNNTKFKKTFGELNDYKLKTTPKGYTKDHPEIETLKQTSFVVSRKVTDAELLDKKFASKAVEVFETLHPFNAFLNRVMG